ncbi:hypothetical protein JW926_06545 [Candidatus Sumerlaeota bacterium]|nr:hypothetical protein [Candidatus Sumerlaeota bacterium]
MINKAEEKNRSFNMIAKTIRGAEEAAAAELSALGASQVKTQTCTVDFEGDRRLLYKANIWCRTVMRILVPLRVFHATDKDELYQHVGTVNWSRFMNPDGFLTVDAFINNSAFRHSMYVAQRTKDAIVDQFRSKKGRRPSVDFRNPDLRVNIFIEGERAILSLDSSGEPLFRRGYRTEGGGEAPLNEVLAASIVALSKWDAKTPLIDPMCGSGTVVIEAALLARRKANGLLRRSFGFTRWKDYDRELHDTLYKEASQAMLEKSPCTIVGSDINREIIYEAKANARRAGVDQDILFEVKSLEEQTPPSNPGMVIMNPPYDKRLKLEDMESFYRMIGDSLKRKYKGYQACIFTGSAAAAKSVGLQTSSRIPLFNGPLECRLLKYDVYEGTRKKKATREKT